MNKPEFEALTGLEKAEFINKELNKGRNLKEIAEQEINMSRSWVEKKMYKDGYSKERNSIFVYDEKKHVPEATGELTELLKYKETLIALAKRIEADNSIKLDFTVLDEYVGEDSRFTVKMNTKLYDELQKLSKKNGVPQSSLISLAVYHLIQSYN